MLGGGGKHHQQDQTNQQKKFSRQLHDKHEMPSQAINGF